MKIEQAIEVLERRLRSPFVRTNTETIEATKLGIEALKYTLAHGGSLPGEG